MILYIGVKLKYSTFMSDSVSNTQRPQKGTCAKTRMEYPDSFNLRKNIWEGIVFYRHNNALRMELNFVHKVCPFIALLAPANPNCLQMPMTV